VNKQKTVLDVKCSLCPAIKGIIKPISEDKSTWAHIICVNWTPEIWFTDDTIEKVEGIVPEERKVLSCLKCRKHEGSCIQCDYKSCAKSYHVRCAVDN
jgi:hypothetical protein